jgi:hypothetical protein
MGSNPQCRRRALARSGGSVLALALSAGLCACSSLGDNLPAPLGLPQNMPERPAVEREFLPVHDMPPPRDTPPLSEPERKKLEADLKEVRDRQEQAAGKGSLKQPAQKSSKQPAKKSSAEGRTSGKSSD